jgi:hypothetical protein
MGRLFPRSAIAGLGLFEFFDFLLGGGNLLFKLLDFLGVVELFACAGEALLEVGDFFVQELDAFFGFLVHGADVVGGRQT